jgi:hypothetical protein
MGPNLMQQICTAVGDARKIFSAIFRPTTPNFASRQFPYCWEATFGGGVTQQCRGGLGFVCVLSRRPLPRGSFRK